MPVGLAVGFPVGSAVASGSAVGSALLSGVCCGSSVTTGASVGASGAAVGDTVGVAFGSAGSIVSTSAVCTAAPSSPLGNAIATTGNTETSIVITSVTAMSFKYFMFFPPFSC